MYKRRLTKPDGRDVTAFIPVCARYPYEVWIAPLRPAPSFAAVTGDERADFAELQAIQVHIDA
jgi:galactose-1-phosphate uridylyltransferase